MIVKLLIHSLKHFLKDSSVNVSKRKSVFIQPQQQISSVYGQVHKHPECIRLRVSSDEEISDNKVDSLSVSHGGEVVGDSFEYILEYFLFLLLELECSIKVLLNLSKAFVVLRIWLELMI